MIGTETDGPDLERRPRRRSGPRPGRGSRSNVAAWHAEHGGEAAIASGDTREGFAQHLEWERAPVRRPLGGRVVAERVRRPRRVAVGVADLRGGVLPGRRARSGSPRTASSCWPRPSSSSARPSSRTRILPRMAAAEDLWCQGWSEPDAGSDLAGITSRADPGRRRLAARRPEDVDHPGRVLHPPVRPVPHRPRGRAAPRPHLLPGPARHAGRDGARVRSARRRRGVRRGVLRRRLRARRRRSRRRAAGRRGRAGGWRWRRPAPSGA